MKFVTFEVHQTVKNEIPFGVEHEKGICPCECGCHLTIKTFVTKENGTFYEIDDEDEIEFWTDKHPSSRFYDNRLQFLRNCYKMLRWRGL